MRTVLVIDDNPAVGSALELLFGLNEIRTLTATSPEEGLARLESDEVDVVIADMNFRADTTSGDEGTALFRAIRAAHADMPVILLTAWTRLETAVELVKAGAADYLAKPWEDAKLLASVENLLELSESTRRAARDRAERARRHALLSKRWNLEGLVFASEAMARTVELACQVARAEVPVLITGPNGSGKERIARIVHTNSAVRDGPFVAVNCGALPSELVEAELFGAEAGAFTGAVRAREGRFERADGGTLFLDEIGNLPPDGQMKLLRVLETGEIERVGGSRPKKVKVRVVSATNADLESMIHDGRFRMDLYYRLEVIRVALPPLCERTEDILPLAEHFLAAASSNGAPALSDEACEALCAHAWPGNVRELKNALERARLLCGDGPIRPEHLGLPSTQRASSREIEEPSREALEAALAASGGVVSRAAKRLGLSRQALYRRLERHGLSPSTDARGPREPR